jgi:hypothetical protein
MDEVGEPLQSLSKRFQALLIGPRGIGSKSLDVNPIGDPRFTG